jgi:hypothetical protein
MFEGVKGVIRSRRSKTDRQCNGQKKKNTNNDLQNTTQKTKDWATRTPHIHKKIKKIRGYEIKIMSKNNQSKFIKELVLNKGYTHK